MIPSDEAAIITAMAEHLDNEIHACKHPEDWEPERVAEELFTMVADWAITRAKEHDIDASSESAA